MKARLDRTEHVLKEKDRINREILQRVEKDKKYVLEIEEVIFDVKSC